MKLYEQTQRVAPEIVPLIIRWVHKYDLKITWEKPEHDTFTTFKTASSVLFQKLESFVDGCKITLEAMGKEV